MTPTPYLTFRKFSDEAGAKELTDLLKHYNIDFTTEINKGFLPVGYGDVPEEYMVKIKQEDFKEAEQLLLNISSEQVNNVDQDHYLFEFTDDELVEIIEKPDEWSQFDYLLAQKILKERGRETSTELTQKLKAERLEKLAQPTPTNKALIIAGYVFSALGGLPGVFIGWYLKNTKKLLPNGTQVYAFDDHARRHGNTIFWIGIVILVITFILRVLARYYA